MYLCVISCLIFASINLHIACGEYRHCQHKEFGHGSSVCVCDSSYCDSFIDVPQLSSNEYLVYTSSMFGKRFEERIHITEDTSNSSVHDADRVVITIDVHVSKQTILGFGGAFTDSSAENILRMPKKLQDRLFESYFSKYGIGYTLGRVPMGSCDFSPRVYSYDQYKGDFGLANFSLATEDIHVKIPVIKKAIRNSPNGVRLFASPWSAPSWMKTSESMIKPGQLKGKPGGKYYKAWADYFIKFFKEYESQGVPRFWGLTVQNEPNDALIKKFRFQNMGFTPETERDFIKMNLGPALYHNGYQDINLMILDDQRPFLEKWSSIILSDPDARKFVKGIGYHWYANFISPLVSMDLTKKKFPNIFLLSTEASTGFLSLLPGVRLGSWERGEMYSHDILQNLNHLASGWLEWNLVLDMKGGPSWVGNVADASIIFDEANEVFYKQPTYYHLGHFSKFISPGSIYIASYSDRESTLEYASFARPDGAIVMIALNRSPTAIPVTVVEATFGSFDIEVPARSIQTYILASHTTK